MRIAFISDIHGNLIALEAVLADIRRVGVDQVVCLGDAATLGPQPRQTMARLRQLDGVFVAGNHDAFLLDPALIGAYSDEAWLRETIDWCAGQLTQADFDFLRSFQSVIKIFIDDEISLLGFHGSPRSDTDMILATTSAEELDAMLAGWQASVMVGGHTHVQMMRRHKERTIVNVGSVGAAFEQVPFQGKPRALPWAEYAIVDWRDGRLSVALRQVPLDVEAMERAVSQSPMPNKKDFREMLYQHPRFVRWI